MKKKLEKLSLEELRALDREVLEIMRARRRTLANEISLIDSHVEKLKGDKPRRGVRKGTKLKAKYVGPEGETWSGRGLRPRWLAELVARGHAADAFLVQGG